LRHWTQQCGAVESTSHFVGREVENFMQLDPMESELIGRKEKKRRDTFFVAANRLPTCLGASPSPPKLVLRLTST